MGNPTRRSKNGKKFEVYTHPKYKVSVEIRFETTSGHFFFDYQGENYRNTNIAELRALITKTVEQSMQLDWVPVLLIKNVHGRVRGQHVDGINLELSYSRFWIAPIPGTEEWLKCDVWDSVDDGSDHFQQSKLRNIGDPLPRRLNARQWALPAQVRKQGSAFQLPYGDNGDRNSHWYDGRYVLYTDALWQAVESLSERLKDLSERLDALLATEKGRAQLVGDTAVLSLPAPSRKKH